MAKTRSDSVIEEIREVRRRISARFDHEPPKYATTPSPQPRATQAATIGRRPTRRWRRRGSCRCLSDAEFEGRQKAIQRAEMQRQLAGLITNPKALELANECREWMKNQTARGVRFCLPEVVDYEVRRELLRGDKARGLARLDLLKNSIWYLPITTPVMEKAAELWADARRRGMPTADPKALDCDVILASQALAVNGVVATENVGHLNRFVPAKHWRDLTV